MKDLIKILLIAGLVSPLFIQAQEADTSGVKICCDDYLVEIQQVKPGDTINLNTIFKTTIRVIPYDTVGSMAIYEFKDQKCIVYKEYVGTGKTLTSKETFWDSENDVIIEHIRNCYEHLKNGVWKYWDSKGEIIRYEIYNNDILVRTINR